MWREHACPQSERRGSMRRISGYYTDCPVCGREVEVLGFKMVGHFDYTKAEGVKCPGSGQEVEHSKITPVRL